MNNQRFVCIAAKDSSLCNETVLAYKCPCTLTIVVDHSHEILCSGEDMEEIAISKFKATCLEVLERVRKTRKSVLVTRFGVPIAEVTPPPLSKVKGNWLGSMAGTARIKGDIVSPAADSDDWDVLKK